MTQALVSDHVCAISATATTLTRCNIFSPRRCMLPPNRMATLMTHKQGVRRIVFSPMAEANSRTTKLYWVFRNVQSCCMRVCAAWIASFAASAMERSTEDSMTLVTTARLLFVGLPRLDSLTARSRVTPDDADRSTLRGSAYKRRIGVSKHTWQCAPGEINVDSIAICQ